MQGLRGILPTPFADGQKSDYTQNIHVIERDNDNRYIFSFVKSKNFQMVLYQICRHRIKTVFSQAGQLQSFCGNYENVNSSANIIPHEIPCWQVYVNKFYGFYNT